MSTKLLTTLLLLCVSWRVDAQTSARPAQCLDQPDEPFFLSRYPGVINVYLENDLFANRDSDYTSGVKVAWISPNLGDFSTDRCLPPWLRAANRYLTRLHPGPKDELYDRRNVVFTLGQAMYTPRDRYRTDLIVEDRPYAGWLSLGFAYNARNDWQMETAEINIGMVGPAAFARHAQNFIHDVRRIDRFLGWDNQLKNEFGIQAVYERKHKWFQNPINSGFDYDVITHGGLSLGNIATYANAGAEFRIGWNIPDDFGTSPIRPAGDNNAPHQSAKPFDPRRAGVHLFASLDGRAIARDIFLDGNTFADSHSVKRKPFVADASVGASMSYAGWKLAYSKVFRTREFVGQASPPRFGSVSVALEY
jgi:lipid A 3-O-deacylase